MMPDFDAIEALFQDFFEGTHRLSESECEIVSHYIDHGEYGLALTSAVAIYSEKKKVPSLESVAILMDLARRMNVTEALPDLEEMVRKLHAPGGESTAGP
jgi:hypothetical protein